MSRLQVLYADRTLDLMDDKYEDSATDGVLKITMHHPTVDYKLTASGWDLYAAYRLPSGLAVMVADVDPGSMNPGMFIAGILYDDGRQEWTPLRRITKPIMDLLSRYAKRGAWVSDDQARSLGLIA